MVESRHKPSSDHVIRAMTEDSAFRIMALDASQTAGAVVDAQGAEGRTGQLLAELVVGAVLVRETMAPDMRVQALVRLEGGGQILADSFPEGLTRGLINVPADRIKAGLELGSSSVLQVNRVLYTGELAQGVVALSPEQGLSVALTTYFLVSEQIESMVSVGVGLDEWGQLAWAGGFIIQILPEADEEALREILVQLQGIGDIEAMVAESRAQPAQMLRQLMGSLPHVVLSSSPVRFGCNCSEVRVLSALSTLAASEIEEIIESGEVLEIDCDYCGTTYEIGAERLRSLLITS